MKSEVHELAVMPVCSAHYQQMADIDHLTRFDEFPMGARELRQWLKSRRTAGAVVTCHPDVLAFVLWRKLDRDSIRLERFSVHPYYWHNRVGSWLLECVSAMTKCELLASIPKENYEALEFAMANGFDITASTQCMYRVKRKAIR